MLETLDLPQSSAKLVPFNLFLASRLRRGAQHRLMAHCTRSIHNQHFRINDKVAMFALYFYVN